MRFSSFIAVILFVCLAATANAVAPVNSYVQGLTPNWDQPYDYPDLFDATGPGARPVNGGSWDAWCTPTAAAMMMGHWADVKGVPTTGDASKDGNQGVGKVYGGVGWGVGPSWHDYTADKTRPAPGPYPPGVLTDIGWYMNTNNLGANNLAVNPGVLHTGTYVGNCAEGLNDFLAARLSPLANKATTTYVGGAVVVPTLIATIKSEIDANRTVLGHFRFWGVQGPAGPGNGNGGETAESQFEATGGFAHYTFPLTNPVAGPNGEIWKDSGVEQLGHTVTIVGYTTLAGNVTDLIVHDNWPTTVRDVQVSVNLPQGGFFPLDAITTLVPEPGTLAMLVVSGGAALLLMLRRWRRPA